MQLLLLRQEQLPAVPAPLQRTAKHPCPAAHLAAGLLLSPQLLGQVHALHA
jgi:hypothetical protein